MKLFTKLLTMMRLGMNKNVKEAYKLVK